MERWYTTLRELESDGFFRLEDLLKAVGKPLPDDEPLHVSTLLVLNVSGLLPILRVFRNKKDVYLDLQKFFMILGDFALSEYIKQNPDDVKAEQALALGRVFLNEGSGYKEADKAYLDVSYAWINNSYNDPIFIEMFREFVAS